MGQIMRGVLGVRFCLQRVCLLSALVVVGCGSSDNGSSNSCGTQLNPAQFTVSNVLPARGSTVPNSAITQSFTIVGQLIELTPNFGIAAGHTAGDRIPTTVTWTATPSGKDTVYTADPPVTWTTAPGHVELNIGGLFQNQTTGCVSEFPAPLYSYDITAP